MSGIKTLQTVVELRHSVMLNKLNLLNLTKYHEPSLNSCKFN